MSQIWTLSVAVAVLHPQAFVPYFVTVVDCVVIVQQFLLVAVTVVVHFAVSLPSARGLVTALARLLFVRGTSGK